MKVLLHRIWPHTLGCVILLALCSVTVHPSGSPKQVRRYETPNGDLQIPPQIGYLFKRSCMDCHSNQTAWPWYSYVAPASWLVERDVRRGRDHLNLSHWQQYTFSQQSKLLADIASAVKNGEMPLPQYAFIHRGAKLTDAQRDTIYQWARAERRKLRAQVQSPLSLFHAGTPDGLASHPSGN